MLTKDVQFPAPFVAGYAYCGVAALALLERPLAESSTRPAPAIKPGIPSIPALLKFLACRQFAYIEAADSESEEEDLETGNYVEGKPGPLSCDPDALCVGYNGRWNKNADTCYCWWVGGTLQVRSPIRERFENRERRIPPRCLSYPPPSSGTNRRRCKNMREHRMRSRRRRQKRAKRS